MPIENKEATKAGKKDTSKELNKEFSFKMGADPEFNILFQNDRLNANYVMEILFKKDLKKKSMGYVVPKAGELGWDGCSSTGELRPLPSNKPAKIVNHLAAIIAQFSNKIKLFNLSTLSEKASVGGHIHFELPKDNINNFMSETEGKPTATMRRLHRCLSLFYLPLILAENSENNRMRISSSYGKLEDFRLNRQDAALTYEFRAPSAEWLTTPKIANATLSYLGVVFNEFLNHPESANKIKSLLLTNNRQLNTVQELTLGGFSAINNFLCSKIKKALRQFELYPNFKDEIEFLFNTQRVLKDKEKANYNILYGWNMGKTKMPTQRQIMSERKIKEIALSKDMENIVEMINIRFNSDSNCEVFARSLKERVVALNWQLKNNYYIFGLRSGINNYIAFNPAKELYCGQEQVVTKSDWSELFNLMSRVQVKLGVSNPSANKPKSIRNDVIIGIPYRERIKLNTKEFTRKIIDIEKGLKPVVINSDILQNDLGEPLEGRGQLFKTLAQDMANDKINLINNGEDLAARWLRQRNTEAELE